jgi:hypothetical protein
MLKHVLVGASTATMVVAGFGATAFANPSSPPPGCVKNGHPYGPPCGPPNQQNPGNGHNNSNNGNGNGSGQNVTGKNSAFVTHKPPTSSTTGELGLIASIAGVSLAGLIALRKRPATR